MKKVPINEDTIGCRYASTLFVVSSREKELYKVFLDMKFIIAIYEKVMNKFDLDGELQDIC